jgi:hypothetical protein
MKFVLIMMCIRRLNSVSFEGNHLSRKSFGRLACGCSVQRWPPAWAGGGTFFSPLNALCVSNVEFCPLAIDCWLDSGVRLQPTSTYT